MRTLFNVHLRWDIKTETLALIFIDWLIELTLFTFRHILFHPSRLSSRNFRQYGFFHEISQTKNYGAGALIPFSQRLFDLNVFLFNIYEIIAMVQLSNIAKLLKTKWEETTH